MFINKQIQFISFTQIMDSSLFYLKKNIKIKLKMIMSIQSPPTVEDVLFTFPTGVELMTKLPNQKSISIIIKSGDTEQSLQIVSKNTIESISNQIIGTFFIQLDDKKLIFEGKELFMHKAAEDYNLANGSVIQIVDALQFQQPDPLSLSNVNSMQDTQIWESTWNLNKLPFTIKFKGNSFSTSFDINDKIRDLKKFLADKIQIPIDLQQIFVKDVLLENDQPISFYNFVDLSQLQVKKKLPFGWMRVKVLIQNESIPFYLNNQSTVLDLKQLVSNFDIPVYQQNLIFNGNELMNEKYLEQYNIQKNSQLELKVEKNAWVLVKMIDGQQFKINIESNGTVKQLKQLIAHRIKFDIMYIMLEQKKTVFTDDNQQLFNLSIKCQGEIIFVQLTCQKAIVIQPQTQQIRIYISGKETIKSTIDYLSFRFSKNSYELELLLKEGEILEDSVQIEQLQLKQFGVLLCEQSFKTISKKQFSPTEIVYLKNGEVQIIYHRESIILQALKKIRVSDLKKIFAKIKGMNYEDFQLFSSGQFCLDVDEEVQTSTSIPLVKKTFHVISKSQGLPIYNFKTELSEVSLTKMENIEQIIQQTFKIDQQSMQQQKEAIFSKIQSIQKNMELANSIQENHLYLIFLWNQNIFKEQLNNLLTSNAPINQCGDLRFILKMFCLTLNCLEIHKGPAFVGFKNYQISNAYQVGKYVLWRNIIQLTLNQEAAKSYVGNEKEGALFEIDCRSSRIATNFSLNQQNEEILVAPFTLFEVVDIVDAAENQPSAIKLRECLTVTIQNFIFWIDDFKNSLDMLRQLNQEGAQLVQCSSNAEVVQIIWQFQIILSLCNFKIFTMMEREEEGEYNYEAGLDLIQLLKLNFDYPFKIMIYTSNLEAAKQSCVQRKLAPGDFTLVDDLQQAYSFCCHGINQSKYESQLMFQTKYQQ